MRNLPSSLLLLLAAAAGSAAQQTDHAKAPLPADLISKDIAPAAAAVVCFLEGPAVDAGGNVFFSDIAGNRILRMDPKGTVTVFRADSGRTNGNCFDAQGRLISCEGGEQGPGRRRLVRTDMKTGAVTVLTDKYDGKRYNSPNDVCVDAKGRIWFTDPRYGAERGDLEMDVEGVYRVDGVGKVARVLTQKDVDRPNGIAVTPDAKTLYVIDSHQKVGGNRKIWAFAIGPDGTLTDRRLVYDFGKGRGGDGMKLDVTGNLWVAAGINFPRGNEGESLDVPAGVYVISPDGKLLGRIPIPEDLITNLAFGGPQRSTLFVTAGKTLYQLPVKVAGYALSDNRPPPAQAAAFKAGFAERDITPELGSEAPGGYGKAYHKTFHDACKVRAAVFDDGKNRVALVGIDALHIHRQTVDHVRRAIAARTGIPESAVLLGASHSHSSGPMAGVMPGEYDHASALVQKLAYKDAIVADPKYLAKVEQALVEAVTEADAKRVPVKVGAGKGIEDKVAFNRRFKMKNGQTYSHPGQFNPDIVEPAGPTDPEVGVIGAWDTQGNLLGCVVNFACHATTSPGGISANYIYYLEKAVQGYFGKDTVVVFLNGASGDVTQVDNRSPYQNKSGEQWAQFVGGRVGAEAVKVLLTMEPGALAPLEARVKTLHLKRRGPSPERVKNCLDIVAQGPKKAGTTEWTFAKEILMADAKIAKEPVVQVEVQALQVGPAIFLTTPAEYFCAFGLEQKAKSGFPFTFPVSLANGCVGYVPTEEAFDLGGGGYETRLTSYSNSKLRRPPDDACGHRTRPPVRQQYSHALPAKKGLPWSYGNTPPDLR